MIYQIFIILASWLIAGFLGGFLLYFFENLIDQEHKTEVHIYDLLAIAFFGIFPLIFFLVLFGWIMLKTLMRTIKGIRTGTFF